MKRTILLFMVAFFLFTPVFAWWSLAYPYRTPITNPYYTTDYIMAVNNTDGVNGHIVWAYIANSSYLYSTEAGASGTIAIANDTAGVAEKYWENATSRTGNAVLSIWGMAAYHFDEGSGSNAYDSGYSNNATITNAAYTTGLFGDALNFDGDGDRVTTGTMHIGDEYTISFWANVYSNSLQQWNVLFDNNDGSTTNYINMMYDDNNNEIRFRGGSGSTSEDYSIDLEDGLWHHFVLKSDSSNATLWIDGTYRADVAGGDPDNNVWLIGEATTGDYDLNGTIDEFFVFNETMPDAWIVAMNRTRSLTIYGEEETPNAIVVDEATPSSAFEGDNVTFYITINSTNASVDYIDADLYWNATYYDATNTTSGTSHNTTQSLTMPSIATANATASWVWNYTIYFDGYDTESYNSTTSSMTIYRYTLDNCSTGLTTQVALNLTLWNETDRTPVNGSVDTWFYITLGNGSTRDYSFDFDDNTYFEVCIYPTDQTLSVDADLDYFAEDFSVRSYYLDDAEVDNTTEEVRLILLNNTASDLLQVEVEDNSGNSIPNAIVRFVKYYAGEVDDYEYVAMVRTDTNGEGNTYVVLYDEAYAVFVINGSDTLLERAPTSISESPLQLVVTLEGTESLYDNIYGLSYTITYTNATETLRFVVTDPSGLMTSGNLRVYQEGLITTTLSCNDSDTGTTIVMTCTISNTTAYIYLAEAYISMSGDTYLVYSQYFDFSIPSDTYTGSYGTEGVLYTFFIVGTMASMGVMIHPVAMVIMSLAGLWGSTLLGFIVMPLSVIYSVIVVAVIMLYTSIVRKK